MYLLQYFEQVAQWPLNRSGDENTTVTVSFDLAVNKLIKFDEEAGVADWSVFYRLYWNDDRLLFNGSAVFGQAWNSSTDFVAVNSHIVWKPDAVPYDSPKYEFENYGLGVYDDAFLRANGYNVMWSRPGQVYVPCDLNLEAFPFDSQRCTLVVGPWSDLTYRFRAASEGPLDNQFAGEHSSEEWAVSSTSMETTVGVYLSGRFDEVHFTVGLKRFPHYYLVNAVLPMGLVVVLSLLTMWLPIENGSGERLGFSVTLWLTIMATAIFTAELRPATQEDTWLDSFQAGCLTICFLPAFESVLVVWFEYIYEKVSNEEEELAQREAETPRTTSRSASPPSEDVSRTASFQTSYSARTTQTMRTTQTAQTVRSAPSVVRIATAIKSDHVVMNAKAVLRANLSMRLFVFLLNKLPSMEWLITGRKGPGNISPRAIDMWLRHVISMVAVIGAAKAFSDIPEDVKATSSIRMIYPTIVAGMSLYVLAALLTCCLVVVKMCALCGERNRHKAVAAARARRERERREAAEAHRGRLESEESAVGDTDEGGGRRDSQTDQENGLEGSLVKVEERSVRVMD